VTQFFRLVFVVAVLMLPAVALAGPAEDANAVIDRWSAAYTSNDPEAVAQLYWPDAILLGTVSPVISQGTGLMTRRILSFMPCLSPLGRCARTAQRILSQIDVSGYLRLAFQVSEAAR
jgi:hypothetical protein